MMYMDQAIKFTKFNKNNVVNGMHNMACSGKKMKILSD